MENPRPSALLSAQRVPELVPSARPERKDSRPEELRKNDAKTNFCL